MHNRDITEILNKIDEMRAVFVLGQRAVPFLEEVFFFLKEISPLMEEINSSIRESTATMPRATSQLQSVSAATELATTEIMDLVDAVIAQIAPMEATLCGITESVATVGSTAMVITDALADAYSRLGEDMPAEVRAAIEAQSLAIDESQERANELPAIEDVRTNVNRIMISLQVQDITAQQIASVNHLIESIRERMSRLVNRLGSAPAATSEDVWPVYSNTHFDPNARYEHNADRQSIVDSVVAGEITTAAPITPMPVEPESRPKQTPESETAAGPASQAEIDALFQNGFSS